MTYWSNNFTIIDLQAWYTNQISVITVMLLFKKSEILHFKVSITIMPHIFFRNKTFLFFKIEGWNFQVQFEIKFRESFQNFNSIRQPIKKDENNNCLKKLNELKFCEDSRILISNWTWKFQLSSLKNKKVLFLKKIFFKPYRQGTSKRWR